jgi:hypothetical protein
MIEPKVQPQVTETPFSTNGNAYACTQTFAVLASVVRHKGTGTSARTIPDQTGVNRTIPKQKIHCVFRGYPHASPTFGSAVIRTSKTPAPESALICSYLQLPAVICT